MVESKPESSHFGRFSWCMTVTDTAVDSDLSGFGILPPAFPNDRLPTKQWGNEGVIRVVLKIATTSNVRSRVTSDFLSRYSILRLIINVHKSYTIKVVPRLLTVKE
jgi:hypothetical protein